MITRGRSRGTVVEMRRSTRLVTSARGRPLAEAVAVAALAVTLGFAVPAASQTPTMPSALRYGSGLMDVPVSSVLPHLNVTATYSGFFSGLGRRVLIDERGRANGFGPGRSDFYGDGHFAIGLFDRMEAGLALQSFGGSDSGGDIWGLFGRVRLWEPIDQRLGVAVGARYLTSPSFADGASYAPGRLGFADDRLRDDYTEARGLGTNFTPYVVATAFLRGFDGGRLPKNDMTFSVGYGSGMFREGGDIEAYAPNTSNGWFLGGALHVETSPRSQLTVMAEHNGFDVNLGLHYDWDGFRIGAQYLATNHAWPSDGHFSEYAEPKVGILASVAICPRERNFRCRPRMMRRVEPDTIYIPPPPPDTVVVRVADSGPGAGADLPGEAVSLCLSTGQNVPVRVTEAGDTLVGAAGRPLAELRPTMVFAGTYAGNAFWYQDGQVIIFEGGDFRPDGEPFPIDCDQLLRVGIYEGVPVFAVITAARPLEIIFIPERPGVWRRYSRGF